LIEVLIDIAVISLVITGVFSAFSGAYQSVKASKSKITAVSIANEKMEIIRNLPYDDVGTTENTYPPGLIPSDQEIQRNNINFTVHTVINYVDDPSDGTINTSPQDTYPYDYKKVEVRVRRENAGVDLAILTTNIAAKAAETATNTGILYLCVVDALSQPVAQATLNITNDDLSPALSLEFETDDNGCVMVPLLPPDSHNNYHLVVTKDGYSTAATYPHTAQNPNLEHQDIDITEQEVTPKTMIIDKISSLTIQARDLSGNPVPNLEINLKDDYEIYFNPTTYRYDQNTTLDAGGQTVLSDMSYGNYSISVLTGGYYLSSSNPYTPFFLAPDSISTMTIYVTTSASAPRISGVSPVSGKSTDSISIIIYGENFDNSVAVKLIDPDTGTEIVASDVNVHAGNEIYAVVDLTSGNLGFWDILVTNPGGEFARKVDGFEITE